MKTAGSSLIADIKNAVQTMATLVTITRVDRTTYRLTNHDQSITLSGQTYRHDIPFNLTAIKTGSSLGVDNNEMTLKCDGTVFKLSDFEGGVFDKSVVTIGLVDYETPSNGVVALRRGWFGEIRRNKTGNVEIEIVGLMKVLDFEVGRIYSPTCDADLGDRRCKVAINLSQAFDPDNIYKNGDWFYHHSTAGMTEVALTNPDFEADGLRSSSQAITGWTRSVDSSWKVATVSDSLNAYGDTGYSLYGGDSLQPTPYEEYLYQDIDLATAGISTSDIDDGRITWVTHVKAAQTFYFDDQPRVVCEVMNGAGDIIDLQDTGYVNLSDIDDWRGLFLAFPILGTARTIRLYLYSLKRDGVVVNTAFDNVRAYWYDHLSGNPYNDVIHKVVRVVPEDDTSNEQPFTNGSFETDGAISNSGTTAITGWDRGSSADYWKVDTILDGIDGPDLTYMLIGGNDGSGVQKTYQLSQQKNLVDDFGFTTAQLSSGRMVGRLAASLVWGDTGSASRVIVEILNASLSVVATYIILDWTTQAGAPTEAFLSGKFTIPSTGRHIRTTLYARSPTGSSDARVGFDALTYFFVDGTRAARSDLVSGQAASSPLPDNTIGATTWCGELVIKAYASHIQYDEVAAVVSRKEFNGLTITGSDGTYETAEIKWITGNNKGHTNIIRVWSDATKQIKLYFPTAAPIQVGDRYQYTRSCQKRFVEDCVNIFSNGINFRGFPYLPGKIT